MEAKFPRQVSTMVGGPPQGGPRKHVAQALALARNVSYAVIEEKATCACLVPVWCACQTRDSSASA
eukprot:4370088-Lingulodinium_polyedra.AAC.1